MSEETPVGIREEFLNNLEKIKTKSHKGLFEGMYGLGLTKSEEPIKLICEYFIEYFEEKCSIPNKVKFVTYINDLIDDRSSYGRFIE